MGNPLYKCGIKYIAYLKAIHIASENKKFSFRYASMNIEIKFVDVWFKNWIILKKITKTIDATLSKK